MCIFRLGDGKCYVAAQPLGSLPASSGGLALCRAVGAVWMGKGPVWPGDLPGGWTGSLPWGLWQRATPPV